MVTRKKIDQATLFAVAAIIAVGGLIYELILGTAASYLIGDSVASFSLAIGTALFGMGLGSLAAIKLQRNSLRNFILNELLLSLLGGTSVIILFGAYSLTPLFWLVFVLLSISIGFLIGLEIPLVVSMAKSIQKKGDISFLSRVLSLDYIGALIGSLIFPFVLLPSIGLTRSAFAVALFNIAVVYFVLWRTLTISRQSPFVFILASAVAIGLALGYHQARNIEEALNSKAFEDEVVYYEFSPYQRITITAYKDDVRLYLNNQLQFSTIDEARYHETMVHSVMTSTPEVKTVLILGGGDGLIAREVLKYDEVESITLIDLDPAVTDLAMQNRLIRDVNDGALDDGRVSIINQDAFTYVRQAEHRYDVIIADLVDPSNEKTAKLYSLEMYQAIKRILSADGSFITQASSTFFTPNSFQVIANTAEEGFDEPVKGLFVNVPTFGEWGFVAKFASPNLFSFRELPPSNEYITELSQLESSVVVPPDIVDIKNDDVT
ncbi:MAG: polyamine aminopropyltransferase, partial [Candidatus Saccharimonadales bacterium]|nr:polyamine aminopropyltransferase [Candidatus Saccharimonadales bacterium]